MNLNFLKNRTMLGICCITLSILICFGLAPLYNGALRAQTQIVRMIKEVKKGEQITGDKIETVSVGAYNMPSSTIKNAEDVIGKYAASDLIIDSYILSANISDIPLDSSSYLYKLNGTKVAMSITIKTFAAGLSGKLEAEDIITIISTDVGELRQTLVPEELRYVEVLAVTNDKGNDKDDQLGKGKDEEEKLLPSTVTVLVNQEQAKTLAELEEKGKIHISLVYRGSEVNKEKFLKIQDEYFVKRQANQAQADMGGSSNAQ